MVAIYHAKLPLIIFKPCTKFKVRIYFKYGWALRLAKGHVTLTTPRS